jgi:hypothetical protein
MAKFVTASPSPTTSATTAAQASLCLSLTHSSDSVQRGQAAQFTVQVWAENWPSEKVQILLSGQAPLFTSGCPTGNKTASCTVAAPGATPTKLNVQLTAKAGVREVTLKAVVQPATTHLAKPLTVSETLQVSVPTAAAASGSITKTAPSPVNLPAIPLPPLSSTSSSVISPGNAANLFPAISPSAQPRSALASSAPAQTPSAAKRSTDQAQGTSALPLGTTTATAQVLGLIALALAFIVMLARLPRRRKP